MAKEGQEEVSLFWVVKGGQQIGRQNCLNARYMEQG